MRRRLLLILCLLPLPLAGLHLMVWRWAEQQLTAGATGWMAAQRSRGWVVQTGPVIGGGWPFSATITLPEIFISGGEADLPGGLAWSADRVTLHLAIFHPREVDISFDGLQTLKFGSAPLLRFTADRLNATVPLEPGVPARQLDVQATHLRAGLPDQGSGAGISIASLHLQAETRPGTTQGEAALRISLQGDEIALPPGANAMLGPTISAVALDGSVDGPIPQAPGLLGRLTGWRDGGGTIAVQRLAIDWGPLAVAASATLALDEQLQPMGAASARISGWADTLDALVRAGAVPGRTVTAAKAVLSLLARTPDGGGPSEVEIPLTLQDRTVAMGRIPLARLPTISWVPAPVSD